jgi:hypothetical protein
MLKVRAGRKKGSSFFVWSFDGRNEYVTPGRGGTFVTEGNGLEDSAWPTGQDGIYDPVGRFWVPIESGKFECSHCEHPESLCKHVRLRRAIRLNPRFLKHHHIRLCVNQNFLNSVMSRLPLTGSTLKVPCHYAHGVILPDAAARCGVEARVGCS